MRAFGLEWTDQVQLPDPHDIPDDWAGVFIIWQSISPFKPVCVGCGKVKDGIDAYLRNSSLEHNVPKSLVWAGVQADEQTAVKERIQRELNIPAC